MKRLGLLGGMSWESSIEYERWINQEVRDRLGGTASADLVIRSFNFADIEDMQEADDWDTAARTLSTAARDLRSSGAEAILMCTNTMHKVFDEVQAAIDVPLLHIADATADAAISQAVRRVALLGTRYTMEQPFYADRLRAAGLHVSVPDEPDRTMIHDVIYTELVRGIVSPDSRAQYLAAIDRLVDGGAEGVIAGCTEIELLVGAQDVAVPYFPTAFLHAQAAARFALDS